MSKRIAASFAKAKKENRGVLGIFVSAGDPDTNTSIKILDGLVIIYQTIVIGMILLDRIHVIM